MILGFRTTHPVTRKPTFFKEKILFPYNPEILVNKNDADILLPKIHTLRSITNCIEKGTLLHMATGTRTKEYLQFNKYIPELQYCTGTQHVKILRNDQVTQKDKFAYIVPVCPVKNNSDEFYCVGLQIMIDNKRMLSTNEIVEFAHNDGFDTVHDFFAWFEFNTHPDLKLIHWTAFRY